MSEFTGYLMSADTPVAKIEKDKIQPILFERMPVYCQKHSYLPAWLAQRAIDTTRPNSRMLRKLLKLTDKSDTELVEEVNAAMITDNYWIKPEGSSLCYADVRFQEDTFAQLALTGSSNDFLQCSELIRSSDLRRMRRTPEFTNTGSFEKCWRIEDGEWWLYKQASPEELFSELFVYHFCKRLGFPAAEYRAADGFIKTRDFTSGATMNFEPAYSYVGDDEDYILNYRTFENISPSLADEYLQIILVDGWCLNMDRHTGNYGVLRDIATGAPVCFAPNYDNNVTLISRGYPKRPVNTSMLLDELNTLEKECHAVEKYLARNPLPVVTPELIRQAVADTQCPVDAGFITQFVMSGYENSPVIKFMAAYDQTL